jgi:micrococcal nuclease
MPSALRHPLAALALPLCAAVCGCSAPVGADDEGNGKGGRTVKVVRVVDGDTIRVDGASGGERVRYIGIDTPESVKPDAPVECFAERASAFNAKLVAGRRVRLAYDVERRDRFGRLLAYVYRDDDDLFVNAELVRRGYATVATFPPNVAHEREFRRLAKRARLSGRGLWSECVGAG